jgi:hypothetical protein
MDHIRLEEEKAMSDVNPAPAAPLPPNEMPAPQTQPEPPAQPRPLSWLEAIIGGFFLPLANPRFYRHAARTGFVRPGIFFVIFGSLTSVLAGSGLFLTMYSVGDEIQQEYAKGTIPTITIEDGEATVDAEQPFVYSEGGLIIILDTTGEITEIDTDRYSQGLLLTRTQIHNYNNGRYQEMELYDLNTMFNTNPIVLDETTAPNIWRSFSAIMGAVIVLSLMFWYIVVWSGFLISISLPLWAISKLFDKQASFESTLVIGFYAYVPAFLINVLFSDALGQVGVTIPCQLAFIIVPLWIAGLVIAHQSSLFKPADPASLFNIPALLVIPLVLLFAVSPFLRFPTALLLWIASIVTGLAVLAAYLVARLMSEQRQPQPPAGLS